MKIVMCSSKFGKEKPGLGRVQFGRIWPFGTEIHTRFMASRFDLFLNTILMKVPTDLI